jgi:hypothetical protein
MAYEMYSSTLNIVALPRFFSRCCSPKIYLNSSLDVWLTPKTYHCENCGYTGILVMELEEEKQENKEEESP